MKKTTILVMLALYAGIISAREGGPIGPPGPRPAAGMTAPGNDHDAHHGKKSIREGGRTVGAGQMKNKDKDKNKDHHGHDNEKDAHHGH